MDEQQPIWKQALKDSSHPLHQATWLLFAEKMNIKGAAKLLAAQREQVIEYLFIILDDPDLRLETGFGTGWAPIHAVELLGEWKVVEAAPRLLDILREDDWETILHDHSILALEQMGEAIIDQVIAFGNEFEGERLEITAASILSKLTREDTRVFEWMIEVFKRQRNEIDTPFMAENLLTAYTNEAISFLDDYLKKNRISKGALQRIQGYLKDAREGKWNL